MPPILRKRGPKVASAVATRISADRPAQLPQPPGLPFPLRPATFGLIQERICSSLYALVIQAILWNQTRGLMARPVLFALLAKYPTPEALSLASLEDLTAMLQPIGLHNIRALRLIALANARLTAPPCTYTKKLVSFMQAVCIAVRDLGKTSTQSKRVSSLP